MGRHQNQSHGTVETNFKLEEIKISPDGEVAMVVDVVAMDADLEMVDAGYLGESAKKS